jgi:phosphatidylserine/phosphatidylglycerophosphate/cardiolipin synthase-like enzyme
VKNLILALVISVAMAGSTAAETFVMFSPQDNIRDQIIFRIEQSMNKIDIMMFSLTDKQIGAALVKAKNNGVTVRVIVDKSSNNSRKEKTVVPYLVKNGINVKKMSGVTKEGIMHNKVAVFDDKIMVTGSFNWTWSANNVNHENAIFIDDPRVIKRYTDEFNSLWVQ